MDLQLQILFVLLVVEPSHCARSSDLNASAVEELFVRQLFKKYGNESAISFEALEHLFQNLELGSMQITHRLNDHWDKTGFEPEHSDHQHKPVDNRIIKTHKRNHIHRRNLDVLTKCLLPSDIVNLFGFNTRGVITADQFHHMCPVIMVQLDSGICPHAHAQHHQAPTHFTMAGLVTIAPEAWGYGSAAIITISLLGLLSVSIIPCLQRVFLNTVLQFLVALAVGALSGDAMLHLIPHVFAAKKEGATEDNENVYKGLCALAGIYSFFIFGRVQGIYMNRKIKEETKGGNLMDITMRIEPKEAEEPEIVALNAVNEKTDEHWPKTSHDYEQPKDTPSTHEHPSGHGHSHDHPVPRALGALVWRVVIGDGIHNFSDGIAVGVAFANSVTGGLSTSVAVLCHELPHEMGDFAVLLKNGMTIRQAILCNCVSSVLSFVGMAVGLAIGNIGQSSFWIFAGIAGMFLYISLVDLIPEMSLLESGKRERRPFCQLLFQLGGTCLGVGIMLLIALYEDQLNSVFD